MDPVGQQRLKRALQPHVLSSAQDGATQFRTADPFPHAVVDNFLTQELCDRLLREFPGFDKGSALNEQGLKGGKAVFEQVRDLGPAFAEMDDLIQSAAFLDFVGQVTGIKNLLYDPDYIGGGTHENRAGQELDTHVDFNFHPRRGWHRRLNLIVYLNPEWREDWGGALELHSDPWRPPGENRITSVVPLVNRCVIFETSERSWHGFRRIQLPPDRASLSRRSFAIYFYSEDRAAEETAAPHATVYVERPVPAEVQSGRVISPEQAAAAGQLTVRRTQHTERLIGREAQFGRELIDRIGLTSAAASGAQLKPEQADTLRWLIARQDELLRYLYDREKQFTDRLGDLERTLRNRIPLKGAIGLCGDVTGTWGDGWASAALRLRVRATGPVQGLIVRGIVPEKMTAGQQLTLEVGSRRWTHRAAPGSFEWQLPADLEAGREHDLCFTASSAWQPAQSGASTDTRDLAWFVMGIESR